MKPIDTAVRKILDDIDNFLTDQPEAKRQALWYVLSALRGPDAVLNAYNVKLATTAVIRTAALPRTAKADNLPVTFEPDSADNIGVRNSVFGTHFEVHAKWAFDSLGLDWEAVN